MPKKTKAPKPPLGFLDVDGVLNCLGSYPNDPHRHRTVLTYDSIALGRERHSTVRLDRRHPRLLARLGRQLELTWATAWEHDANPGLVKVLELPQELPVVDFGLGRRRPVVPPDLHWKTPTLAAYAGDRPFCWIDDEHRAIDAKWLADAGARAHLIWVDPAEGLTEEHVKDALTWAASLTTEATA